MDQKILRAHLMPILLGDSPQARRMSWRILWQCGIVSYLCDRKKSLTASLTPTCRFFPIPGTDAQDMTVLALSYLASNPEFLPILIPCTEAYEAYLTQYATLLEGRFLIRTPQQLLTLPPLSRFRYRKETP